MSRQNMKGPESLTPVVLPAEWQPAFGPRLAEGHVAFRVWASGAREVTLEIETPERESPLRVKMHPSERGMFEARVKGATDGTLYKYLIDDKGAYPDPASRFQPHGVHGCSEVIDLNQYAWTDDAWRGVRFEDLVIYELHVGAFTAPGSFLAVIDRLPYLKALGVTAIELMPVAAFAGQRNWGYDGVALFAPACAYGRPDDLQRLVDAAHKAGLAVLLDVVYNHLGPDGAYLSAFSPDFFSPHHKSPWGDSVNLDGPGSDMVRAFLIDNALHWIVDYHVDGLRLDATHALFDDGARHFLSELAERVHGLGAGRPLHLIAEDERNLSTIVRRQRADGWGLDGVWADDFHHEVHRALTGEHDGYYVDFSGTATDIATTINEGWRYNGQWSIFAKAPRGTGAADIDLQRFVFCLQNHDQVGNRAFGERLNRIADLAACRAAAALLLLAPETPLLFMGQEWAASTPFLYFTDHHEELGRLVTEGRRKEFARFPAFSAPEARTRIPDPQDEATFVASRLDWTETDRDPHASMLRLYRALIALRGADPAVADGTPRVEVARALDDATVCITRQSGNRTLMVVARLTGTGRVTLPGPSSSPSPRQGFSAADIALTTEDPSFATDPSPARVVPADDGTVAIEFVRPGAIVFQIEQS